MATKYFTTEQISNKYDKLTNIQKIEVLYNAIGYMEQYNGRTKFLCIALAMGYDNFDGDNNTWFKIEKQ
jgi:hypothetical protein